MKINKNKKLLLLAITLATVLILTSAVNATNTTDHNTDNTISEKTSTPANSEIKQTTIKEKIETKNNREITKRNKTEENTKKDSITINGITYTEIHQNEIITEDDSFYGDLFFNNCSFEDIGYIDIDGDNIYINNSKICNYQAMYFPYSDVIINNSNITNSRIQGNGEITLENNLLDLDSQIVFGKINGELNIVVDNYIFNEYKSMTFNYSIKNSLINNTLSGGYTGILNIGNNVTFGENALLMQFKEINIDDYSKVLPYLQTYEGNNVIQDFTFENNNYGRMNVGNLTLINCVLNSRFLNYGNLTLINCTLNNEIQLLTDGVNAPILTISNDIIITENFNLYKSNNAIIIGDKTLLGLYDGTISISENNITLASTTTLTATFHDENNNIIQEGKAIFKVNGKTIRDNNGNVIYAEIIDGQATLPDVNITQEWTKPDTTIQAIFCGNDEIGLLRTEKILINVTRAEANIEVTVPETIKVGNEITLSARVTSGDTEVNTGRVVFKINGKTLKNADGKALYANVTNGIATSTYTLPLKTKAKKYNLTAIFTDTNYNRAKSVENFVVTN